ncbi:MAG: hypothetical protein Q8R40_01915 [bacterium]|nr:hypothetical protein [bacterium]
MNPLAILKKIKNPAALIRRLRLTQTTVLMIGIIFLAIFLVGILMWDGYLFMQSITPPTAAPIKNSKEVSLVAQDIDDAIQILNTRQQQFNTLLKTTTGTTQNLF